METSTLITLAIIGF